MEMILSVTSSVVVKSFKSGASQQLGTGRRFVLGATVVNFDPEVALVGDI